MKMFGRELTANEIKCFVESNAETGYALGINPNTIRAGAKRLFGNCFKMEFTVLEAQRIQAYFNSVSPEQ